MLAEQDPPVPILYPDKIPLEAHSLCRYKSIDHNSGYFFT